MHRTILSKNCQNIIYRARGKELLEIHNERDFHSYSDLYQTEVTH